MQYLFVNSNSNSNNEETKDLEQIVPEVFTIKNTDDNRDNTYDMEFEEDNKRYYRSGIETTKTTTNSQIEPVKEVEEQKKKTKNLFNTTKVPAKVLKKRGPKKKKDIKTNGNKIRFPRKYDRDDIMIKIQVNFINFICFFVNSILKAYKINGQFKKIEYSIKKNIKYENFEKIKQKKLFEILIESPSARYKTSNSNENQNQKLYDKIKDLPTIKNILEENYLDFFSDIYYKSERKINIKKYKADGNDEFLTLDVNIKTYKEKVKSFTEEKYRETYEMFVQELYFNKRIDFKIKK